MIPVFLWARLQLLIQFSANFHMYEWFWIHFLMPNSDLHSFVDNVG